ncbi:hypothetical protein B0H21DRAFT_709309 [Amylocystis lapponica]|nr:hypothetical protein B0H21DRAFT_709309 [Amylocystis lapponica]
MALDKRGFISASEVVVYVPILIIGVVLVLRHGFSKKAGWLYLVILSVMRIVGGVTHILSETTDKNNITLKVVYGICEGSGTSPLLLATMGFLQAAASGALDNHFITTKGVKLAGLVATVGLILAIMGGVKTGNASTESDLNEGVKLRRIGTALFVVVYAFDVLFNVLLWSERSRLLLNRRKFLTRITFALPFLSVRILYSVLSAFAPTEETIGANGKVTFFSSNSGLARFSQTSGDWALYLIMSVVAEFITVVIYAVTGMTTSLENDYAGSRTQDWDGPEEMARLKPAYEYAPYAPGQTYAPQPYAPQPYAPQPYSQ